MKWSQITKKNIRKCIFEIFFLFLGPFSIKFPIVTLKIYHHREGKELQRLKSQFWKWHDVGNNLGGCRTLGCDKGENKHHLSRTLGNCTDSLRWPRTLGNSRDSLKWPRTLGSCKDSLGWPWTLGNCTDSLKFPRTLGNSTDNLRWPRTLKSCTENLVLLFRDQGFRDAGIPCRAWTQGRRDSGTQGLRDSGDPCRARVWVPGSVGLAVFCVPS